MNIKYQLSKNEHREISLQKGQGAHASPIRLSLFFRRRIVDLRDFFSVGVVDALEASQSLHFQYTFLFRFRTSLVSVLDVVTSLTMNCYHRLSNTARTSNAEQYPLVQYKFVAGDNQKTPRM